MVRLVCNRPIESIVMKYQIILNMHIDNMAISNFIQHVNKCNQIIKLNRYRGQKVRYKFFFYLITTVV